MITIFRRNYKEETLKEFINNEAIYNILLQTNQKMQNPNLDIQNIRRHIDQRVKSLQEINTFTNFLKTQHEQKDKTEAYQDVEKQFPVQLIVRGDGNCFYRSFIVNYILKIIFYNYKQELFNLILKIYNFEKYDIILDKCVYNFTTEEFKLFSLKFLFDTFLKRFGESINILSFIEQYNQEPEVDLSLIVICRNFIKDCFLKNNKNPSKQFFIEDDDRDTIPKLLEQYGTEAQDTIISFSANNVIKQIKSFSFFRVFMRENKVFQLFININYKKEFKCILYVQSLYRDRNSKKMLTYQNKYQDLKSNNISVEVLFTQGHYNVIFDSDFSLKFVLDSISKPNQQSPSKIQKIFNTFSKITNPFIQAQIEENNKDLTNKDNEKEYPLKVPVDNSDESKSKTQQLSQEQTLKPDAQSITPKENKKDIKIIHYTNPKNNILKQQINQTVNSQNESNDNSQYSVLKTENSKFEIKIKKQNISSEKIINIQPDQLQIDEKIKKKKRIFLTQQCDYNCIKKYDYNLIYIQICQSCLLNKCLLPLIQNQLGQNNNASFIILQDLFQKMYQQQTCLICLNKKFSKLISTNNNNYLQQFICDDCEQENNEQNRDLKKKLNEFIEKSTQFQIYIKENVLQDRSYFMKQLKYFQLKLKENLFCQRPQQKQKQQLLNDEQYRQELKNIMNSKSSDQIDTLIHKMIEYSKFSEICFKCEVFDERQFSIRLYSEGSIKLCPDCIKINYTNNIFSKYQSISIYCGLIDRNVNLKFTKESLQKFSSEVQNECFECFNNNNFVYKFEQNIQLCFGCLSKKHKYWVTDENLVSIIKSQLLQNQICLGCLKSQHKNTYQDIYDACVCNQCRYSNLQKIQEDQYIFNIEYNRHFIIKQN